ncbi:MAG: hypothetical protein U0667_12910 [Chloroflexota bacterium]
MTTPTTLTCEADTSGRYSTRAHPCGLPATAAFKTTTHDGKEKIETRCAKHAGIIKRTRWPGGSLVDLTPEVADAIAARQAETKARRDAERAAKRQADAVRTEAARVEAHELDAIAWTAVRSDEQALDTWTTDGPVYRDVPRWEVRRDDGQGWDTATVKADRRTEGWPVEITLSAPSRLTRRQAIALAEALLASAGADAPCDGFTGGNAWGACAKCGHRLEDHAA